MKQRTESSKPEILTVEEVAKYLKVTERSIYSLLSRQESRWSILARFRICLAATAPRAPLSPKTNGCTQ
jgi:hypothetical protein